MLAATLQQTTNDVNNTLLFVFIGWMVISPAIGYMIGKSRGRPVVGAVLGFFLGWIGWIIAAVIARSPEAEARRNQAIAAKMQAMAPPAAPAPAPVPEPQLS